MADFSGHSEKFHVSMVDDSSREDVLLELSMEGLKVMNPNGNLTKRKYPLDHITRWSRATDRLTMFVKTPVDIEEKSITLYGSHSVLSSLLDTLTSFCLQLVEIMEAKEGAEAAEAAREMKAVARNGGRRHRQLKNADEVEFWSKPEKAGYMFSQGEVIKTWRKRWFVLKDGFLFRFLNADVSPSSKPRGIVDLSKVGDVSCGKAVTGRPNSIKLGTQKGHVAYLIDSETEMVEWISALEVTVQRLVRIIAGVDDEDSGSRAGAPAAASAASGDNAKYLQRMEQSFRNMSTSAQGSAAVSSRPSAQRPSTQHYAGSANYPSVAALPGMPHMPSYSPAVQSQSQSEPRYNSYSAPAQPAYSDAMGVSYGMGTGTSMGGIAGIGGVRNHNEGSLPATLQVVGSGAQYGHSGQSTQSDTSYTSYGQPDHGQQQQQPYQSQAPITLPETLNVSIIDQLPAQQPVYGMYGQSGAYSSAPPMASPPPPPARESAQWETHYSAEGRPYYYDRVSGQTQWDQPM